MTPPKVSFTRIKEAREKMLTDVTNPELVDIRISGDGKVLWVNVDGICRLRACQIKVLKIYDERPKRKKGES